jgi:hypothetical protein
MDDIHPPGGDGETRLGRTEAGLWIVETETGQTVGTATAPLAAPVPTSIPTAGPGKISPGVDGDPGTETGSHSPETAPPPQVGTSPGTQSQSRSQSRPAPPADATAPLSRMVKWIDNVSMWPLSIVVGGFAAGGQHIFARLARIEDPWAWGATSLFELVMIGFFVRGWLRGRDNLSPAVPWGLAIVIGAAGIAAQLLHSENVYQAMIYGFASAGVLLLWLLKMWDSYRRYLRDHGRVIAPIGKYGRVWLLNPRRAFRAMLIGTEIMSDDVGLTLRLSWTWQATYRGARLRRAGTDRLPRHLAKITAWNAVNADPHVNRPHIDLGTAVIARVHLVEAAAPIQARATIGDALEPSADLVDQWRRDHDQPDEPKPRVIEAAPVSPPVGGPSRPTAAELTKWREQYADAIAAVKRDWRDESRRDWSQSLQVPTTTEIKALTDYSGQGVLMRIRNVIIADRAADAGVD